MQEFDWQKIEEIFNRAAVLPAAEREAFVEDACQSNADLRREVLALLDYDQAENSFLDEPVFSIGVRLLDDDFDKLLEAKTFAAYELKKLIGRGGMGAVFLAVDTRLEREVAVKVLPSALANNHEADLRFRQEARAASNVAHPNIAHIYEFGENENRLFLAMEYVRGRTLRELIKEKAIDKKRAVEFAVQIARALQAAHVRGIVHRDIKPENVIVTNDNLVKVLDFGLAKLTDVSAEFSRLNSLETTPGIILGTTAYMSPEQVRGAGVDFRSDLWSLSVIFYEMICETRPFTGETASDVRASILRDEPDYKHVSPAFQPIFDRTLRKNKDERYETVTALIEDLERLKNLDETNLGNKNKNRRDFQSPRLSVIAGSLLLAVILGGAGFYLFSDSRQTTKQPRVSQINRITNTGKAKFTTISANGDLLAYSLEELEGRAIYVMRRNRATNEFESPQTPILAPSKNIVSQLTFSPDKKFLYYKMREPSKSTGSLYRIAVNSNNAATGEKILDNAQGAPSFSPDGKQFVFFRLSLDNSHEDVIVTDGGGNERVLWRCKRPQLIPDTAQPVWSPDGKTILIAGATYGSEAESYNVYKIDVTSGAVEPILKDFWGEIWATTWIENGAAFVFTDHHEKLADNNQLWRASFPNGEVTRLTNDYNDYFTISAAQIGNQTELVSLNLQREAQIYSADANDATATAIRLTAEGDSGYGISVGADGQIFYGSTKTGNPDIWEMDANGGNQKQLTSDARLDSQPFASHDSKFVFFGSYRSGLESLWRMKTDGSEQTLLATNIFRDSLAASPDGKWIYYRSSADEAEAVWRVSADSGEPQKFANGNYKSVAVSPDGKLLAATLQIEDEKRNQLAILSVENPSQPLHVFEMAEGAEPLEKIRFTPDGKSIAYIVVQKGIGNIWTQTIDGNAAPKPLTDFKSLHVYSFDFTRGGKRIYCARGELNSRVVRLTLENK